MGEIDFSTVTEITGNKVTKEQLNRMYTRYRFAAEFCDGRDVLEVACGTGQGLGLLAKRARRVFGGDVDEKILKTAKDHYENRGSITLKVLDAHKLDFENNSFDVVILYEAIYYLDQPNKFIKEAMRILRNDGVLLICLANKELPDFNPSPYSREYFSAKEIFELLQKNGFKSISLFGDCPVSAGSAAGGIISLIKRTAVRFNLIPKTMEGKELLKRIFFGKLQPLPQELNEGMSSYTRPVAITPQPDNKYYKVIFAVARKGGQPDAG